LALLQKAYASIPPEKAAEYLGLSADVVISGNNIVFVGVVC
jgi:hypothetical protein